MSVDSILLPLEQSERRVVLVGKAGAVSMKFVISYLRSLEKIAGDLELVHVDLRNRQADALDDAGFVISKVDPFDPEWTASAALLFAGKGPRLESEFLRTADRRGIPVEVVANVS